MAPIPLSYLEAEAQTLDNGCKVACCIPSKPRFVGSELPAKVFTNERMRIQTPRAMRIFAREELLPLLSRLESCAMQPGANQLVIL